MVSVTVHTSLSVPENVAFHSLGEGQETVIVSLDSGYLYTCNKTTRAFLQAVDGQRTVGQIADRLHEQFDVELQRLRSDLLKLAQQLLAEGLVTVNGPAVA